METCHSTVVGAHGRCKDLELHSGSLEAYSEDVTAQRARSACCETKADCQEARWWKRKGSLLQLASKGEDGRLMSKKKPS